MRLNPFFLTKCEDLKSDCQSVFTNTGRMYTSGQTFPFNFDGLPMALQMIAEKLGMDPIDVAYKTSTGRRPRKTHPFLPASSYALRREERQ